VDCYSCENAAINACKRCAKPYCDAHGNALYCAECLRPESALPSFNLYRAALLTMLAGTALAVFLIIRPPGDSSSASPVLVGRTTPDAGPGEGDDEPTVAAETPVRTSTPRPTPAPTEAPFDEYVIVDGDTLYGIAEANLAPGDDLDAFARAIAALNGLDFDFPVLTPGETLLLPKPPTPTPAAEPTP
jgi:LysM repeat protein